MIYKSVDESGERIVLSELACRKMFLFLSGDLPLFALEYWLNGADAQAALPDVLYQELTRLNYHSDTIHQEITALVKPYGAHGLFETWHLLEHLPWIVHEDPRATKSMSRCSVYHEQGLRFLWPIADAFLAGRLETGGFDWVPVEKNAKEILDVARFIIQGIESKEILILNPGHFEMSPTYTRFLGEELRSMGNWRTANQEIHKYLKDLGSRNESI